MIDIFSGCDLTGNGKPNDGKGLENKYELWMNLTGLIF